MKQQGRKFLLAGIRLLYSTVFIKERKQSKKKKSISNMLIIDLLDGSSGI